MGATLFFGGASSISERVGRSAVLTATFFTSVASDATAADALPFGAVFEAALPPALVDPERADPLSEEAFEEAFFGAEDFVLDTLEAILKVLVCGVFP